MVELKNLVYDNKYKIIDIFSGDTSPFIESYYLDPYEFDDFYGLVKHYRYNGIGKFHTIYYGNVLVGVFQEYMVGPKLFTGIHICGQYRGHGIASHIYSLMDKEYYVDIDPANTGSINFFVNKMGLMPTNPVDGLPPNHLFFKNIFPVTK